MTRHQFLLQLHRILRPRNYLEIGVDVGVSLALSRVPSIGIDPEFAVTAEQQCDLHLVRATSDAFFAREDPIVHLRSSRNPLKNIRRGRPLLARYIGGTTIDLAFVDGLHLAEFALRDFMNIERFANKATVIVFDDMLPRDVDEAARDRHTEAWTGDVYKVVSVLREYRPDLTPVLLDTFPTGVLVVLGADPSNTALRDNYDRIERELMTPDPQAVPRAVLERDDAIPGEVLLNAKFWPSLVRSRNIGPARSRAYEQARTEIASLARR